MSRTVSMGIFSYDRSEEPPSLRRRAPFASIFFMWKSRNLSI